MSSDKFDTILLSSLFYLFTFDIWVLKFFQWFKSQKRRVNAESKEWWWWTIKINNTKMRLTLSTFTSFIILLLIIDFESGIVYVVEVYFWILFINDFDSIFNSSPKSGKSCFRFVFSIEWEQSGITNNTMIETSLSLRPEHSSKWSFHGFSFDKESLMWWQFKSLSFIWCLSNKVVNKVWFHYRSVKNWCTLFKIFMLSNFVKDRELVPINYSVH